MPVDKVTVQNITNNTTQKATDVFYVSSSDMGYIAISASSAGSPDISASHGLVIRTGPSGSDGFKVKSLNNDIYIERNTSTGVLQSNLNLTDAGFVLSSTAGGAVSNIIGDILLLRPYSPSSNTGIRMYSTNTTPINNNSILYASGTDGLIRGFAPASNSGSLLMSNGTTWAYMNTSSLTAAYALNALNSTITIDGNTSGRVLIAKGSGINISGAAGLTYDGNILTLDEGKFLKASDIYSTYNRNITISHSQTQVANNKIIIQGGDEGNGARGSVEIYGGSSNKNPYQAGDILLKGGTAGINAGGPGGSITLSAGTSSNSTAYPSIKLQVTGAGLNGDAGHIELGTGEKFVFSNGKNPKLKFNHPSVLSSSTDLSYISSSGVSGGVISPYFPLLIYTGSSNLRIRNFSTDANFVVGQTFKLFNASTTKGITIASISDTTTPSTTINLGKDGNNINYKTLTIYPFGCVDFIYLGSSVESGGPYWGISSFNQVGVYST